MIKTLITMIREFVTRGVTGRSWDKSLLYAEFSYNNSYQKSLKMAPFEMLYGQRCISHIL
jgi:hypothetical protein